VKIGSESVTPIVPVSEFGPTIPGSALDWSYTCP